MHARKVKKQSNKITQNMSASESANSNANDTSNNVELLTSAPKRVRETLQNSLLQNSLFENISKTPRLPTNDSPFKLLNLVDRRFEKITEVMKTLIHESEARMIKEFDKRFDLLKIDILNVTQRVTKLESVADDIVTLKDEVSKLKTQLQRQENSLIASDLRINGIPYRREEDLYGVFTTICNNLNVNTPAVKSIYRLQNFNNKHKDNSPNAVIMVKLLSPYDKNFILKSIANFRKRNKTPLLLRHIGENCDRPFYINENLTSLNFKILQSAVGLKKAKRLKSVFTLRGLVYIKFNSDEEPVRIDSMENLLNFFPMRTSLMRTNLQTTTIRYLIMSTINLLKSRLSCFFKYIFTFLLKYCYIISLLTLKYDKFCFAGVAYINNFFNNFFNINIFFNHDILYG